MSNSTEGSSETRARRKTIPARPQVSTSLWSIVKNCIGKELTKIPMPVTFNEPLSFLQRLTEDLEYSVLLDQAAEVEDSCEQLCYIAAYAISCYSTTGNRTTKPFNPLLGETFEHNRPDLGWRSLAEQVSHHPPCTAHHANGKKWTMFQDFTMASRFRGKYLSVTPSGHTHVAFNSSNNHYTYHKVTTTVHNIIVGTLWIDNHGEVTVENHATGDKCILKFHTYSYLSPNKARKVYGVVKDARGNARFVVQGHWDKFVEIAKVTRQSSNNVETEQFVRIWSIHSPIPGSEKMYNFTKLAIELNEDEDRVAPTDSRKRPDQRLMEQGKWDEANREKERLEQHQREVAAQAAANGIEQKPAWFEKRQDPLTGDIYHMFTSEYWQCKKNQDWSRCPAIF
ncbi:hypothetical protein M3Y94_00531100 [Aphelenchoides besseyi]|nr:hypothetical protein M3Y94_00531100 [Aphelenchoides besseyi]